MKETEVYEQTKKGNGMHLNSLTGENEPIYCTVNDWTCPYYKKGICFIENPVEDCEDFQSFFPTWEEWEEV